ncbi:MAG: fibronectin type III domain-containing protein [Saprospiraceae bacterium]|nr:fibronectin type III domain-containing protein [Saprospiraceae bacterium]
MRPIFTAVLINLMLIVQALAYGTTLNLKTPAAVCVACNTPTGLAATGQTGTTAILTWGAVAGATGYSIEVENGSGNPNIFKVVANVAGTSYTVTGLLPNLTYKFKVRSRCGGNKSNWTAWFSFNSSAGSGGGGGGACSTPGNQTTSNLLPQSATLNWAAVPGVSGYRIRVENASGNPNPFAQTINLPSGTTSYTIIGLLPGKSYKWKVRSLCGTQTSDWSPNQVFTTPLNIGNGGGGTLNFSGNDADSPTLKAFPNPSDGLLNLEFSGSEERVTYRVANLLGKLEMSTEAIAGQPIQLDLGSLPSGIYLVSAQCGAQVKTQKITLR